MTGRQVEVLPGGHLVATSGEVVVVVAHRERSAPTTDSSAVRALRALTELARQAAELDPRQPGRPFARLATRWAIDSGDSVEFGALSPAGAGLAVFLHGGITAVLVGTAGVAERIRGSDAAFTVDRVVDVPAVAVALYVDEPGVREEIPQRRGIGSLVEGVAQGAAAIVWIGEALLDEHAGPATELMPEVVTSIEPDPHEKVVLASPAVSERIDRPDVPEPPRPPLPIRGTRPMEPTVLATIGVKVMGFKCARAHLNDPRVSFCSVCGIRMDQMTGVLAEGVRPPLGLLIIDDGTTFVLDADCVIGRDPEKSDAAREGLRPIRLIDNSGGMSRAHAEIRLQDWDVAIVDRGSTNGTHIRLPGTHDWLRLAPHQPQVLVPGAEVMIGNRVISFDSPHGQL